jgi:hypothetical protein
VKNPQQPVLILLAAFGVESPHRVTSVASFILLADIGNQRLRPFRLNFEGGDQRIFRVDDNMSRLPPDLNPTANCTYALPRFEVARY